MHKTSTLNTQGPDKRVGRTDYAHALARTKAALQLRPRKWGPSPSDRMGLDAFRVHALMSGEETAKPRSAI